MFLEIFIMAFEALMSNKLRSALSMLGIIIGVSTVIVVVGIGLGSEKEIADQYKNLNVTSIIVMGNMGRGVTGSSKVGEEDINYVLQRASNIETGTAVIQGNADFSYGKESGSLTVIGTQVNMFDITNLELAAGRLYTEEEVDERSRVVIIGDGVRENYFDDQSPESVIGESIKIANKPVEVIGVLAENGASFGPGTSYDESILAPYETAEKNLLGKNGKIMLTFLANDVDFLDIAMAEVKMLLRESHKLKDSKEDDFRMFDAGSMVSSAQSSASTMTILLTSVAAIVLLVSGIGIMNVMFVTVSERTKEIGIMKAVGAKQEDILIQFLMESVILSLIGGTLGILIGQIAIPVLNSFEGWNVIPSITGVMIAFTFSVLVGIFFGFYPALKASRLDPVDALRGE